MRGCLSYEIVSLMRAGISPQKACETAVKELSERKIQLGEDAGSISVIALSPIGAFGAATTLPVFPLVAGNENGVSIYAARPAENGMEITVSSEEALEDEP